MVGEIMHNDIVIKSKNIFTGKEFLDGFIAIKDGVITEIGRGDGKEYCNETTKYIDASEGFITPGLSDTHCFFTGHYINSFGEDLKNYTSLSEVITIISDYSDGTVFVGRHIAPDLFDLLSGDQLPQEIPVVIFHEDGEKFIVNNLAAAKFEIASGDCNLETYWKLIQEILKDAQGLIEGIKEHHHFLYSRGVTAIKEVIFDDSYGVVDALTEMIDTDSLKLRVRVVSQPVGHKLDLELGKTLQETLTHKNLKFSGYNMMVDGSMSQYEADLKEKYIGKDFHSIHVPDYEKIKDLVHQVDNHGFRIALHAQGDRAISKTIDILSEMKKDAWGKLKQKHTMTDLEFGAVEDFIRMAPLGIIAEIYPQIQSIYDDQAEKIDMIKNAVGDQVSQIWNRRGLSNSGTLISCATDLPLLFPSLPESIYHACGGYFQDMKTPFQQGNTLTRLELITAWTTGGALNLFENHEKLGMLQPGYHADLAIYEENLLEVPMSQVRDVKVVHTIINGEIVYSI